MSIELKNVMEDVVVAKVEEIMNTMPCCRCDQCKIDVVSYVLNRFPSKYVSSNEGSLIGKLDALDKEFEIQLVTEIVKAVQIVNECPRHHK